jgi:tetratricopeptide (TPR) repeat protein
MRTARIPVRRVLILAAALLTTVALRAESGQAARPDAARSTPALKQALAALYSGDSERALQLASNFLKEHPNNVDALVLAARAHLAREENGIGYELLRKALEIDARNADVLYFLGIAAGNLAAAEFDRAYKLAPDSARVHQLMARSLRLQEKVAEAAAEYELALQRDANLLEALLELAAIRREESNCAAAIALYERAEGITTSYEGTYGLGACLAAENQPARAIDAFTKALAHDPRSAIAHFGLGSALLQTGDALAAARELERAVSLQPKMRQGYYLLGRAYASMNMPDRSREAFARAEELAKAERAPKRPE